MSPSPLVSVIVPCYNQAKYLPQALDSVLSQTYTNWECIVINDGSTDETEVIISNYLNSDNRFKYFVQDNSGVSMARNNGIRQSSGEYILPLDADDYIAPDYLSLAIKHFIDFPNCKLVYCQARYFGARTDSFNLPVYSYERLLLGNIIFCSAIYKKTDFNKTQGYNQNMVLGLEDWDFWLSFLTPDDDVFRINQELFFYRIKEISRNVDATNHYNELVYNIIINHPSIYKEIVGDSLNIKLQFEAVSRELEEIRNSFSYKLGRSLTYLIRKTNSLFKRFK